MGVGFNWDRRAVECPQNRQAAGDHRDHRLSAVLKKPCPGTEESLSLPLNFSCLFTDHPQPVLLPQLEHV
jgi:hypothetical protein